MGDFEYLVDFEDWVGFEDWVSFEDWVGSEDWVSSEDWVGSEGWVSSEDWAYFVDDQEDFLNLEALQTEKVKRPIDNIIYTYVQLYNSYVGLHTITVGQNDRTTT